MLISIVSYTFFNMSERDFHANNDETINFYMRETRLSQGSSLFVRIHFFIVHSQYRMLTWDTLLSWRWQVSDFLECWHRCYTHTWGTLILGANISKLLTKSCDWQVSLMEEEYAEKHFFRRNENKTKCHSFICFFNYRPTNSVNLCKHRKKILL